MADRVNIAARPRTVLGKKVKQLRRQGTLPANVYGRGLESVAIEVEAREFSRNIKAAGIRGMFELDIAGEEKPRYVVIRGLTRQGGMGEPTHVDFYQVDPNQPITANVPIHTVGEAPAVRDLAGVLLQSLDHVSISCLPLQIPEAIELDVSPLVSFEVTLSVGDITPPEGVVILTDPAIHVATVNPPRIRLEPGEEAAEEEAEAE
ncbi:MAG: 50S ribosomal protein L25 [Chloroflexi bacterium]|nr:50S ribosomal protein L25 [Chloroflexota bacterium]